MRSRRTRLRAPSPSMAVAITALVVALGGTAYATIPAGDGTINGCYQKQDGQLRVVDTAADCRASEVPIAWSQRGPQGDPGPQGPQGETGPAGPQGPPGVTKVTSSELGTIMRRTVTIQSVPPHEWRSGIAYCQTGERVISGGAENRGRGWTALTDSEHFGNGWLVGARNVSDDPDSAGPLIIYVDCLEP